jgi:hypothetical protein
MAPSPFQSVVLKLLAQQRRERGESYVAGGVALNALTSNSTASRPMPPGWVELGMRRSVRPRQSAHTCPRNA